MQKYKEINGNDYVKNSRTTINETMQSIQSMNSGTAFPTNNLFEGMKCYRTDLKKTYTLTDVENNTWVEDAHATLSDEATHAASATKLQTARSLNLGGAVTADAATFDGTANATINVKTLDATKLKGTASVSTTGNAATATKVVTTAADGASANIAEARMASDDLARIRVSGTTNAGELALETADDGSEPIVARQYTGIYTTPVRTAKILDESGNTSFPGTVVAPKFTGALNGNAATATKLQTPRTLSLTGKAAGSTAFDGSSNAAINVTSVNADTAVADSNGANIAANYVKKAVRLITENLNDIHTPGLYFCDKDVNATTARNYPTGKASAIIVAKDGANGDASCTQLCMPYQGNGIYKRQYEPVSAKWSSWRSVAFEDTALLRSGGSMSGALNFANGTWNLVGDDSYMGDHNIGGTFCIKGANDNSGIALINVNNEADYARISYGGGNINFNKKIGGNLAGTADNADTVDGIHAASLFYSKGNWDANNWATIGAYEVSNNSPVSGAYNWGQVISSSTNKARFQLYASHAYEGTGRLHYRTGYDDNKQPWNTILDSENYNLFAPTKTGGGASGTWGINISGNADTVDGYHASDIISKIYPVGSIYMSMSATNPHDLFGVGTWQRISQGRMLLGADDSTYKAGATGGEATHTLTAAEMPAHSHSGTTNWNGEHSHTTKMNSGKYGGGAWMEGGGNGDTFNTSTNGNHNHTFTSDNTGGGAAHNNMPPYLACYIWQRTA